jgi:hypothetical protein
MLGRYPACFSSSLTVLTLVVACGIVPSRVQSASVPNENLASERKLLAESFASAKLSVWQKRLNLQGWDISVVVSRAGEFKPKTIGHIRWDRDKKTAVIRVLDPADYALPLAPMLQDIEFTVVHELIHLEMAPVLSDLHRTEANRMEEEHAVNQMAEALLKLDRGQ